MTDDARPHAARLRPRVILVWLSSLILGATLVGAVGLGGDLPPDFDRGATERLIAEVRAEDGGGRVRVGVWFGGPTGDPWYSAEADALFPTASAIKTAILVELFARFADDLDRVPPGLADHLQDTSPTIAHFAPEARAEVRRELAGKTVRQIGGIMMEPIPASNAVYNAAASISIALLGGPEGATRAIQARDPAFAPITVRRYMLADRTRTGDNTASPAALAAVFCRIASGNAPGLARPTVEAIRASILARNDARGRRLLKDGLLESDPLTIVRTGVLTPPTGPPCVFAVMLARDRPDPHTRETALAQLGTDADRLVASLLGPQPAP